MTAVAGKDYTEAWLSGPDSHAFYTRTYTATPVLAVILFLHGFAEHIGRYEHAHVKYPAHGINVFAFDLRGYGRTALDVSHRSPGAAYGKTCWKDQMRDIEFFARHLKEQYPDVPLFLMGHSAGGAQVLAYFTRPSAPPTPDGTKLFKAAIASSPCLHLTSPKPRIVRWAAAKLALAFPHVLIPADVGIQTLSRNPAANEALRADPYCKQKGSLRGLNDMLTGGEALVAEDYKQWPKTLPVLFLHGTGDQLTSYKATEDFYKKIDCSDKKLSLYEGAYHELVHEIDGIPERLVDECVNWALSHVSPTEILQQGDE